MKPTDLSPLDFVRWCADSPARLYTSEGALYPASFERVRKAVLGARAVRFTPEASRLLAGLSLDIEAMVHLGQSAACPWPTMLIHIDPDAWVAGIRTTARSVDADEEGVVWLIQSEPERPQHLLATALVPARRPRSPAIISIMEPISFEIDFHGPPPVRRDPIVPRLRQATMWHSDPIGIAEYGGDPLDILLMGAVFNSGSIEAVRSYAQLVAPRFSPILAGEPTEPHFAMAEQMIAELVGGPRQVMAAITALSVYASHPQAVSIETSPRGHRLIGGKRSTYLSTSTVTLHLAPFSQVMRRAKREYAKRRRYEVRGFWRHHWYTGSRTCDHVWDDDPGHPLDPLRQVCRSCGLRRTWIANHWRGDASIGFVHQEEVKVVP